jgi:glycosyltransferase involved in cell wall biosynthesis
MKAAAMVRTEFPQVQFLLCGDGIDTANVTLASSIEAHGLGGSIHLLGRRSDTSAIMASLDVYVSSSSSGEGFPNVVGEAMSSGIPCVVTDVGDSGMVVGGTGKVVPPRDPTSLAQAVISFLRMTAKERADLGLAARRRIIDNFALDVVVERYAELYFEISKRHNRRPASR